MARLTNNGVLMLIVGLVFAGTIHAAKQPTIDSSGEIESNESNRIDNVDSKQANENGDEQMAVSDQISVLSRQLEKLTEWRQEDYRMLERSLHSYVQKHFEEYINVDIKKELKDFRAEIKTLRQGVSPKKEKLTEWLSSSIAELRSEISELQASASNLTKSCHQRNLLTEDIRAIRDEMNTFKLEVNAMKTRQDKSDVLLRELREEIVQSSEDFGKSYSKHKTTGSKTNDFQTHADRKMRHYRLLRQQVHELELNHRSLKRNFNELQNHKLSERVRGLEVEQQRLATANFNISRQVSDFDKLHKSLLELLEDVEEIETKLDKTVPEIRREISKVEIDAAQLSSDQNILKEEDHNMAKTIQALAVSISTLQNERSTRRNLDREVNNLKMEIEILKAAAASQSYSKIASQGKSAARELSSSSDGIHSTAQLFEELESVETQYESIVQRLPSDCSEINSADNGLHMIAPMKMRRPIMAKCDGPWTVVQKRQDGSVDFNRSWEEYARGFGDPNGELWIGNEILHHLTSDNCTKLRIIIQDLQNNSWYADYESFSIASRAEGYRIDFSGYSGNASNTLEYQNHMKFSSIDVDLDISKGHCADEYEGGWWFSHCLHANLNGRYNLGLTWYDLSRNEWVAVKNTIMMITKRHECLSPSEDLYDSSSSEASDSSHTTNARPSM